jgi:hypothetical protein
MFDQLSAEIVPSLTKGRPNTNPNKNKAKCIPGGTLRVLAGKNKIYSHFPKVNFPVQLCKHSFAFLLTRVSKHHIL